MTSYIVTWRDYVEASPEMQRAFWNKMIDLWSENYANELAVDAEFDHTPERNPWLDEHTVINGDATRVREAGKMTALRISTDRRPSNPRYR